MVSTVSRLSVVVYCRRSLLLLNNKNNFQQFINSSPFSTWQRSPPPSLLLYHDSSPIQSNQATKKSFSFSTDTTSTTKKNANNNNNNENQNYNNNDKKNNDTEKSKPESDLSFERKLQQRIRHIHVHPKSVAALILPGNVVTREYKMSGLKHVPTELEHGIYWMVSDLRITDNKQILSNLSLIPKHESQPFPMLQNCKTLSGNTVDVPFSFMEAKGPTNKKAKCTLVAISFRDFGYNLLSSWINPYRLAFESSSSSTSTTTNNNNKNNHVNIQTMLITEQWSLYPLQWLLTAMMKRNTPPEYHDSTLVYFGDTEPFRDVLRMHNVFTGYVFLLDNQGHVRFAASGKATDEELQHLIQFTYDLIDESNLDSGMGKRKQKTNNNNNNKSRSKNNNNRRTFYK